MNETNELLQRLQLVLGRIRAAEREYGRRPDSVTLLAVSKTHPGAAIRTLFDSGQPFFGESYLQEAQIKIQELADLPIEWHFIGPIQSNKTKTIAGLFSWVHSVDRDKIARRLHDQRPDHLPPLNVCLQVNISGESSKSGVTPEQAEHVAREILLLSRLRLRGLMAIPEPTDVVSEQRATFRKLAQLREDLQNRLGVELDTLSMGMSHDLEAAIAEGATIVRVGTDIFGARQN